MDIVAHGLWSLVAFSEAPKETRGRAILWGIAPDLIPFSASIIAIPWVGYDRSMFLQVYPFTHSLILFATVFTISTIVLRSVPVSMLAWGMHVLVDIPGHRRFLTPFLFPLSDFRVMGSWEWLSAQMLVVNYLFIGIALFIVLYRRRRKRQLALAQVESRAEFSY